jgi:hypothetical protein
MKKYLSEHSLNLSIQKISFRLLYEGKFLILCLFFSVILSIFVSESCALAQISQAEREALIALYNLTDGDNWRYNKGWKNNPLHTDGFAMPGTECTWAEVICDTEKSTVKALIFVDHYLNGSIPSELGKLKNLYQFSSLKIYAAFLKLKFSIFMVLSMFFISAETFSMGFNP